MRSKLRIFVAAIVLVLVVAAIVVYFYRDSIARNVANSVLRGYDLEVVDLSIESIDTRYVRFRKLELRHRDGTRYVLSGLSLPLDAGERKPGLFTIRSIELIPTPGGRPTSLAESIDTFLDAPAVAPGTTFVIGSFSMPDWPPVTDITWTPGETQQRLQFESSGYSVDLLLVRLAELHQSVMIRVARLDDATPVSLDLQLFATDTGFSISADADLVATPLLPLLYALDIVPQEFTAVDAHFTGPVSVEIPRDPAQPLRVTTELTSQRDMSLVYQAQESSALNLRLSMSHPVNATLEYPSLDWHMTTRNAELVADLDIFGKQRFKLADIDCKSGISCALRTTFNAKNLQYGDWRVADVRIAAPLTVKIDEQDTIALAASTAVKISGAIRADYRIGEASLVNFSGATILRDASGWQASVPGFELRVERVMIGDKINASFPLKISAARLLDDGNSFTGKLAIAAKDSTFRYADTAYRVTDIAGDLSLKNGRVTAQLGLSTPDRGLRAAVNMQHDLRIGAGSLAIRDTTLDFGRRALSKSMRRWPYAWDVVAGSASLNATAKWTANAQDTSYTSSLELAVAGVAGNYKDLVFAGLDFAMSADFDSSRGPRIAPLSVTAALFDIGLPLEDIVAELQPDLRARAVQVNQLSLQALGGTVTAAPFSYRLDDDTNEIVLLARSVQPRLIIALADFKSIDLSGSLSGSLPLTVSGDSVAITGGHLENDPPGGVIRYGASTLAPGMTANKSQLGIVTRALSNFQYKSLNSDVNYSKTGDLQLKMRIEGINPDLDATQPIILNLGLEDNIPQLLRSLRASRSIEDILEKRVSQ